MSNLDQNGVWIDEQHRSWSLSSIRTWTPRKRSASINCTRRITARSVTRKKCKKCGKTLTAEEIVKGYQFEPEQYVIVSPEDIAKIKLKSTKVIEIEGFIDAAEVHPLCMSRRI